MLERGGGLLPCGMWTPAALPPSGRAKIYLPAQDYGEKSPTKHQNPADRSLAA